MAEFEQGKLAIEGDSRALFMIILPDYSNHLIYHLHLFDLQQKILILRGTYLSHSAAGLDQQVAIFRLMKSNN